ncbi:CRISPR-associated ring nuclease Csm6 [Sphaerotilus sp.]|uniref:CRISPR-associated ring nuclease Csm6 n=1 Tax=Sphaerotilus sp. TaxID=2093942 RepID=UPI00286DE96C|nr:CRISPR-associated ring nuclease Csm6 [Sphaerotilus sp.]
MSDTSEVAGAIGPACYPRRVLLTVSGLSPQIITETLYALAVGELAEQRFLPTEIVALTTSEGARRIQLALLSESPGGLHQLIRDYALPPVLFGEAQIHAVCDAQGTPLADIRSDHDNACMADAITSLVRDLTADPDCALHVSIAGGRKTMGYYAGYALSLFGRAQDRLSHVLVSAPFESSFEFYYPTPYPKVIQVEGGRSLADAATAVVSLAQIPFVRLRGVLPAAMLAERAGFQAVVQAADARLGPARLVVDVERRCIEADGVTVKLAPWSFALMAVLGQRARAQQAALTAPTKGSHDAEWAAEFLCDLSAVVGQAGVPDSVETQLSKDCTGDNFSQHRSRLVKALTQALGAGRVGLYFDDGGRHRDKRYRIPLGPGAIEIRRAAPASLPNPRQRQRRPDTA